MTSDEPSLLSPPETTVHFDSFAHHSPEQNEQVFGKLWTHRLEFLCRSYFGSRELRAKNNVRRHYAVATFRRMHAPMRLLIRDSKEKPSKSNPKDVARIHHATVANLGAEDLRLLLGDDLYEALRADHRNTMIGIAIQLIERDRVEFEEWAADRTARIQSTQPKRVELVTA